MTDLQHFAKLIKETKFAMLTTTTENGSLNSRPMTLLDVEFEGDLWFFAPRSSELARQVGINPQVNLGFSNIKDNAFVSACGYAVIVKDASKERELWNPVFKSWFPEGLEDPDLCLLRVTVESADYWESPASPVAKAFGFAEAVLTGKKTGPSIGKHGHINLN